MFAEETDDWQARRWTARSLADLEIRQGHPQQAVARLLPLLDRAGMEEFDVTLLLPVLALAHLESGAVPQAMAISDEALERARREDLQTLLVEALEVRGRSFLQLGLFVEARRAVAEGLTLAFTMPYPYAHARLLLVAAEVHHAHGQPEPVRAHIEDALTIFRRLGAHADLARAEQFLHTVSP